MICDDEKGLDKILFLVKGCLKIYYISIDGKTHALTYISPFAMLGDMEFVGEANGPYAVAVTEVECIAIALAKYQAVLEEDRNFCKYVMKCLGRKVTLTSQQNFFRSLHTKESRLAMYILVHQDAAKIRHNWSEVASLLAISYRQLMRLLSQFCTQGYLERVDKKGTYKLINQKALQKLADQMQW